MRCYLQYVESNVEVVASRIKYGNIKAWRAAAHRYVAIFIALVD